MRWTTRGWPVWCVVLCACAMLLGGRATAVWGQGNIAVVTGTQRVFVRRGPGTEFPAFASLQRGSVVEVQEMQGEWSRVKTARGELGYIHSNFLALPNEARSAPAVETPYPQPTVQPTMQPTMPPTATARPASGADAAAARALTEKNKALEAQLAALQEELSALKSRPAPPEPAPTTAAAGGETEELRAELRRLTAAVEGLQNRVGGSAPSSEVPAGNAAPVETTERSVPSTALVLGAAGLFLGWLLGAAYGRNQERGRRSRIRF